ncbi:hypothetical protein FXE99_16745 [Vibrio mimicus]|nr:hypothetical protein FXE99_16745 [Vibrio mimicus]
MNIIADRCTSNLILSDYSLFNETRLHHNVMKYPYKNIIKPVLKDKKNHRLGVESPGLKKRNTATAKQPPLMLLPKKYIVLPTEAAISDDNILRFSLDLNPLARNSIVPKVITDARTA